LNKDWDPSEVSAFCQF